MWETFVDCDICYRMVSFRKLVHRDLDYLFEDQNCLIFVSLKRWELAQNCDLVNYKDAINWKLLQWIWGVLIKSIWSISYYILFTCNDLARAINYTCHWPLPSVQRFSYFSSSCTLSMELTTKYTYKRWISWQFHKFHDFNVVLINLQN